MAFLTPDNIRTEYGLTIKEKILPTKLKPNRKLSNGTGKVEHVTIHNTEDIDEAKGTNDAEQYARATHNDNMKGVSVHYFIDETDCWQLLKEDEMGYHAADGANGPGNTTSLAIEIIMDGSGSKADKDAEDRGAKLAAILLHKHGLSIDRLTTHNRWYSKKYCPVYILPHWDSFKKKVEKYLNEINGSAKPTTTTTTTTTTSTIKKGNLVSFKSGAKYYHGGNIPSWVTSQKWYVAEVIGDRAVIDKNESGTSSIMSPVNVKYLTVAKATVVSTPTIKVGSTVKIKQGAKTYTGGNLASFVYTRKYKVKELIGNRAVVTYLGITVAAVNVKDLTLA